MRTLPAAPRRMTAADISAVARTLARAFEDDPVAAWSFPADDLRPRLLERFYATRLRQVVELDEIWVDPSLAGAAMWLPPESWHATFREELEIFRSLVHPRLLARTPFVVQGFRRLERRHPTVPHWYLYMLGTDPDAQGRGIGSALLAPVLERCDEDGIGAYLESSKEANIAFYARHGFRVTGEHDMPRGPRMWLMWREPR
jgi:ribosomal protein S18 acetylase RimI-like enzyme